MSHQYKGKFLPSEGVYWNKNRRQKRSERQVDEIRFETLQIIKTLLRVISESPDKEQLMKRVHEYFIEHEQIVLAEKLLAESEGVSQNE